MDFGDIGPASPAVPGEVILLYGTGFGPSVETDAGAAALAYPPAVTIGGHPAEVWAASLSAPGLCQLNVKVPDDLPGGAAPVVAWAGGVRTQDGVFLAIGK